LLRKIRNESEDNPFIWKDPTFTVGTHVNIIEDVALNCFRVGCHEGACFIEGHSRDERVAMMRSDVVYLTPIDIFKSAPDGNVRYLQQQVLVLGFALRPINDRMFYGPYEATEIWATGRFPRLDEYIYTMHRQLHSEQFLDALIFPAIRAKSISVDLDPGLCFWREGPINRCGKIVAQRKYLRMF
jgi:hypothetical protein